MFRSLSTVVLLLLFALPGVAYAQNTGKLSGQVTDADTGEPLIGANVYLPAVQRGAATDIDGNYTILGISVGEYDIQYSYTGYQTETLTGVEISQGRTRTVDIELSSEMIGEVIVEYERPLIQRDAIGVPKVVTGADIQNLPVRGVANVAAIQAGVVNNDGSGDLNIRGGRSEEVDYYVDGVKVLGGQPGIPQQAIAEQEMLIGTIPPQYGDATAGVISISTRSGGSQFFGAAEAITSYGLDSYGYNLGALSIGGPIVRDRVSFFASIQGTYAEDDSPYALETLQLRDDLYNVIQGSPQVVRIARNGVDQNGDPLDESGIAVQPLFQDDDFLYLPLPNGFSIGGTEAVSPDSLGTLLGLNGDHPGDYIGGFRSAYDLFSSRDQFTTRQGKDDPSTEISTTGNLEFRPVTGVNIRVGGGYQYDEDRGFSYDRSFFNRDRFRTIEDEVGRGYVSLRQVLSNTAFYQIQAEFSRRDYVEYPDEFGKEVSSVAEYGNIDNPANAVAANYVRVCTSADVDETGCTPQLDFIRQFSDGNLGVASSLGTVFSGPGTPWGANYNTFNQEQFRVFGSAQTQVGVHELSFGGEYETRTVRQWALRLGGSARNFARFIEDGPADDPLTPEIETGAENPTVDLDGDGRGDRGVASYAELPYSAGFQDGVTYYGYNYLGTEEVDGQSVDAFGNGTNFNVAPYRPIYYGGFLRDRVEYRDIVLDLGVRVDVFDNNTLVLRDPYALVDLYRVEDLRNGDITNEQGDVLTAAPASIPANIDGDFAFYQSDGEVVGYRNNEGQFFSATGERVSNPLDIQQTAGGAPLPRASTLSQNAFRDYDPAVTFMPRVGVTFPVTDRALFFASFNVTSQRPSENAFASLQDFARTAASSGTIGNPNLRPETTTQYELGFRQRVGQQAALTLSGFYRTQRNKITLRNFNEAFPSGYTGYTNLDFSTTKGVELAFDLRRTRNLAVNANYTLSFAEGTGSDSRTARIIAWRSQTGVFPETLAPLAFDRRHNLNVSLDYRLGDGEGPMVGGVRPLAGFGFNLLGVFQSGSPYTELDEKALESPIGQSTNGGAVGSVNSVYLPFTSRIDLKVDRAFNLGPAAFRGYVWVQNLLDQDQVYSVYRDTGLPDNDGFLEASNVIEGLPTELEKDAFRFLYSQYVGGPVVNDTFGISGGQLYGLPRRIRLGVTLDF